MGCLNTLFVVQVWGFRPDVAVIDEGYQHRFCSPGRRKKVRTRCSSQAPKVYFVAENARVNNAKPEASHDEVAFKPFTDKRGNDPSSFLLLRPRKFWYITFVFMLRLWFLMTEVSAALMDLIKCLKMQGACYKSRLVMGKKLKQVEEHKRIKAELEYMRKEIKDQRHKLVSPVDINPINSSADEEGGTTVVGCENDASIQKLS
ncbi:hypothetical protein Tco_0373972 [Tanacetum coccineum]